MSNTDIYDLILSNRKQIAKDYLQFNYLNKSFEDIFDLVNEALNQLPAEGLIIDDKDLYALQAIGYLVEVLPLEDARTLAVMERFGAARLRRSYQNR